ncbi:hypothetical protein [Spongiactinospora sp. 9N601]|uniref:hypothetical protein n=1 Tax=Spongiactinospora sp. 9N601 TaxID=3375149 RepID=UPI0037A0969C
MVGGGRNDIIETGSRSRWGGLIVAGALLVLVGIPVVGVIKSRGEAEPPLPRTTLTSPTSAGPTREYRPNYLVPDSKTDDGRKVVEVTFPDGTRARLSYPAGLDMAEFGVRPVIGVRVEKAGRLYRLVAPLPGESEAEAGQDMLRSLTSNVSLWAKSPVRGRGYIMMFDFGSWSMALSDPVRGGPTFDQRMDLAKRIRGKVDKKGYLVLRASGPVELARPGDLLGSITLGPQLWFGGGTRPLIVLAPVPKCGDDLPVPPSVGARRYNAIDCKGGVMVAVAASDGYTDRLLRGLRIELL